MSLSYVPLSNMTKFASFSLTLPLLHFLERPPAMAAFILASFDFCTILLAPMSTTAPKAISKTKKLSLTGAEESTGGGTRDVEWAVGTNYVWVEGSATNEHYVIEIPGASVDDASVSITLADIIGGQLLFVDNYERKRVANLMKETMGEAVKDTMKETIETLLDETLKEAIEETIKDTMKKILEEPDIQKVLVDSINEIIGEDEMQAVVTKTVMTAAEEDIVKDIIRKEQNNGPDAVSVSALVVGSVALFTGIALVVHSSMGVASAAENVLTDDKTLGSKNVA